MPTENFSKTFAVGTDTIGPYPAGSFTQAAFSIDRTVAGGLNSLTAATIVVLDMMRSTDGGVTWTNANTYETQGGPFPFSTDNADFTIAAGVGTHVEMLVTVTGPSSVVLAGSVTIS